MVKEATTAAAPKKEKRKPRSKEQQLADLQAEVEQARVRKLARFEFDEGGKAATKGDFTSALKHALRAVELLTPADATRPLIEERAAE